ncbi:hypothetical protein HDU67_001666 [Dinochytrium kinnereticum]|nr:hypothetical protein HDU67_001666 [Dinochytrium kinnereticum]
MYILVGSELSYYTAKTRAYLRHKGIHFEETLSTSTLYANLIIPQAKIAMIPILIDTTATKVIQDTKRIVEYLEALHPNPSVAPTTPLSHLLTNLLELWADEWLVLPAMHYRWSFMNQRDWLIHEFGKSTMGDVGGVKERMEAGRKAFVRFERSLPVLGVSRKTAAAVETQLMEVIGVLDIHLRENGGI